MTGKEAYITLKEELKARGCLQQYLDNLRKSGGRKRAMKSTSPEKVLQNSFPWGDSPEGWGFWETEFYILQREYTLPF